MATEEFIKPQRARKLKYRDRMVNLMNEYKNILIIKVDNVGSRQMQLVRIALRGVAVILMGKNTVMRRVIRDEAENNPKFADLLPHIVGNIGFVFTNGDLMKIRSTIEENKVPAPARVGMFAPKDVYVPPGPTGLDPGQTNFFQAMNIATKISRGAIEVLNEVHLVRKGERVGSSSVALLGKLGLKPFFFGIVVDTVYEDGSVYSASILDLSEDDLLRTFFRGVGMLAAISMELGYPNAATIPHSFGGALKKMIALSMVTEYTFDESALFKDPEALAAAMAAAGGAAAPAGGDDAAAGGAAAGGAAAAVEEEEEEEPMTAMFDEEEGDY